MFEDFWVAHGLGATDEVQGAPGAAFAGYAAGKGYIVFVARQRAYEIKDLVERESKRVAGVQGFVCEPGVPSVRCDVDGAVTGIPSSLPYLAIPVFDSDSSGTYDSAVLRARAQQDCEDG